MLILSNIVKFSHLLTTIFGVEDLIFIAFKWCLKCFIQKIFKEILYM